MNRDNYRPMLNKLYAQDLNAQIEMNKRIEAHENRREEGMPKVVSLPVGFDCENGNTRPKRWVHVIFFAQRVKRFKRRVTECNVSQRGKTIRNRKAKEDGGRRNGKQSHHLRRRKHVTMKKSLIFWAADMMTGCIFSLL